MTREDNRREAKEHQKIDQYAKSGFIDRVFYVSVKIRQSKYIPHIGKKQIAKGLVA